MPRADQARVEIALIHMGAAHLGMDQDTRRAMIARLCGGKTSSKDLTWQERQIVIGHLKASGFEVKPRSPHGGRAHDDGLAKLRKLWYLLADAGAVTRPDSPEALDAAIDAWARKRMPELAALRFASRYQMQRLIEQAKRWCRRVGVELES